MMHEHFSLKLFKLIFLLAGLKLDSARGNLERRYLLFACICYILLTVPQVFSILLSSTVLEKANAFVYLFASSSTGIILAWLHLHRSNLLLLYDHIGHDCYKYIFNPDIAALFESKLKRRMIYVMIYFMVFTPIIFWMPYFIKYYSDTEKVDPVLHFFFPAVYPWEVRSTLSYHLTMLFQTCVVSIAFPILTAMTCAVHYFHVLLSIHLRQLQHDILSLDYFSEENEIKIQDIVRSHKTMKKCVDESKTAMLAYIYVSVSSFFLSGSLMTLSLVSFSGSLLYYVRTFSYQFSFTCNLIFCTQVGQLYYELNEKLLQTLYTTEWYKRSSEFRKDIIIFMMSLQRRWEIRVFNLKTLNWFYISDISKFTYSALQLLLKLRNSFE